LCGSIFKFYSEDGGGMFLRKPALAHSLNYVASYLRRTQYNTGSKLQVSAGSDPSTVHEFGSSSPRFRHSRQDLLQK